MENISPALLNWFYENQRVLPFRTDPSPYHVWLSEIMLQQTRVSAALPYYERFLAALPDIPALAACEEEKLNKLWEGLGYYSRVRNLQKAARIVCEQYGGELPADYDAIRALPGIGDYTAGAICSISFGIPVPAVDGNVLRVFSRLYNDPGVITDPAVKKAFTARVMEHQPPEAPGDYNQALMELGALVCVPNGAPLCEQCPLARLCQARAAGTALSLPQKAAPKARKLEDLTVALVESPAGFLIQQRPEKGLLAGLWQPLLWEGAAMTAEQLPRLPKVWLFGRGWCGYACWTAMVLDFLPYKVPKTPREKIGWIRYITFAISLIFVSVLFLAHIGNIERIMFWAFIIGNAIYYIVGIILAFVFKDNRAFCKYICPITIFLKPMSYFSLLRIKCDKSKCVSCGKCKNVCPMEVDVTDNSRKRKNGTECILCFECVKNCPRDAL